MKKFFTLLCLLAFCFIAINVEASPQKDVSPGISFNAYQASSVEIAMVSVDYAFVFQESIENPLKSYVLVEIGKQAYSPPMETDFGNYRASDNGLTTNNQTSKFKNQAIYGYIYLKPVIYKNLLSHLKGKNYGYSCGGQGDMCRQLRDIFN